MREQRTYTDEDKAQALSLMVRGYSPTSISRMPLGSDEVLIPQQTLSDWRAAWDSVEVGAEQRLLLRDDNTRITLLAGKLTLDVLEQMTEEGVTRKDLGNLNMTRGIGMDKDAKGREVDHKYAGDIHIEQAVFIIKKGD